MILLSSFFAINYIVMQNEQAMQALYLPQQSSKHGQSSQHESQMNIETDVNLTKKKRIIFWVYLLTILTFFIALTVMTVYSYLPTKQFLSTDNYYYSHQIAKDWQKGFIVDVIVVNSSVASCPANYQNALNFQWPGSSFGCFCNTSANLSFVLVGYCSPGLIQVGCNNMFNQQPIIAHNWINKGLICIKRSSVSFANQKKYDGTNKICGSSQSLIIMPLAQPCPFVNISFSPFQLQDHYSIVNDPIHMIPSLYVSYNSTSPYSFYSYPFTKFAVSQYQFCQMDMDTGIDPLHSDFILLNIARGCAETGNYTKLSSMTQIQFYNNNPTLQALTSLKGFPNPDNWQYKLGFSSLSGWTYKCRHTYNNKFSIPKAIQQFNFTYYNAFQNFLIGITICLIIIILQIIVLTLRRIINNAVYPIGYKQRYLIKHFWMALSRYLIDLSAKIAILGIQIANLFTIYTNYNWFKSAVNLNCPDGNIDTLFNVMNPYMVLYNKLLNYAIAAIVICVIMLVIDVIHFVYIYRGELVFYLVDSGEKQMVKKEDDEQMKWIQQKDEIEAKELDIGVSKDLGAGDEEFRITMAQNIFSKDEMEQPQKLKKKKKKKISPLRRKQEVDNQGETSKQMDDDLGFNPYLLQDDSITKLDSPQFKSITSKGIDKKKRKK